MSTTTALNGWFTELLCHSVLTGLHTAPSSRQLEEYIERINASRPQCPVGLTTLVLPKRNKAPDSSRHPYVYLACGHVHGAHDWKNDSTSRTCPMCMKVCCRCTLYDLTVDVSLINVMNPVNSLVNEVQHMPGSD